MIIGLSLRDFNVPWNVFIFRKLIPWLLHTFKYIYVDFLYVLDQHLISTVYLNYFVPSYKNKINKLKK